MYVALIYHIWEERNGHKHGAVACTIVQRFARLKAAVMVRVQVVVDRSAKVRDRAFVHSLQ